MGLFLHKTRSGGFGDNYVSIVLLYVVMGINVIELILKLTETHSVFYKEQYVAVLLSNNMTALFFLKMPFSLFFFFIRVLFSPMVSGWAAGGQAAGKSLSGLYLRNRKV